MDSKRRLPVLKTPGEEAADEPPRPPWQWVGFGAVAIFVVWTPLAYLAGLAGRRFAGSDRSVLVGAGFFALGSVLAALAGGYLVGRWGAAGVGVREAAFAGLAAALVATVLAWMQAGLSLGPLVTVLLLVPAAALGGRLGLKGRAVA
jgi:hypothetical protein